MDLFDKQNISDFISKLLTNSIPFLFKIIAAILIFIIGRLVIKLLNKGLRNLFAKRNIEKSVSGFLISLTNTILYILLILTIIGSLGISVTSVAALLASFGVTIGMALSGNLQNFAGGLMILLFKPYKVGDYINAQNSEGFVVEILIFHTKIRTYDNRIVYVPNGILSNGVIVNFSEKGIRRINWEFGVSYGEDIDKVRKIITENVLSADERILKQPKPSVSLDKLADSSVVLAVRAWVKVDDYWQVFYDINENVYKIFNEKGITIPFPQLTIHQEVESIKLKV